MKIGVSCSVFLDSKKSLPNALDFLEGKVKYVELLCDGNLNIMKEENIEVVDSYNLKYTLHCPLTDLNLSSFREKIRRASLDLVRDILQVASKVNSSILVLHPGYCVFKDDYTVALESLIKTLKELNRIQEEYSTKITIENMPSYSMFMFREPTKEILEHLEDIGITFDIGHAFLNRNIESFLERGVIEKITHVHIHDNNGDLDEHLCIGKGRIPFGDHRDKLRRINGIKMIEMQNNSIDDIVKCIEHLKDLLE
ncbi:MAG TPA: sugar phosphate isomerase/epimerase [Methanothermococcus okinawensis]|nr:sugar phosphate isomerase/epimerase [Methanothermococcus okinawensis]